MAFSIAAKNAMLDALTVNRAQLHDGPPGASGTDNPLGSLTAVVFDAASGGERAMNADVTLTGLGADQPVSYVSFWKAAGTIFYGSIGLTGATQASGAGEYILIASGTKLRISDP